MLHGTCLEKGKIFSLTRISCAFPQPKEPPLRGGHSRSQKTLFQKFLPLVLLFFSSGIPIGLSFYIQGIHLQVKNGMRKCIPSVSSGLGGKAIRASANCLLLESNCSVDWMKTPSRNEISGNTCKFYLSPHAGHIHQETKDSSWTVKHVCTFPVRLASFSWIMLNFIPLSHVVSLVSPSQNNETAAIGNIFHLKHFSSRKTNLLLLSSYIVMKMQHASSAEWEMHCWNTHPNLPSRLIWKLPPWFGCLLGFCGLGIPRTQELPCMLLPCTNWRHFNRSRSASGVTDLWTSSSVLC